MRVWGRGGGEEAQGKTAWRLGGIDLMGTKPALLVVQFLHCCPERPSRTLRHSHSHSLHSPTYLLTHAFCPCPRPLLCRYAKKQVLDESGTLVNLLQLWQLVVRHPDVFYESRAQFVPQVCRK